MERKGASYRITTSRAAPASQFGDYSGATYTMRTHQETSSGQHHAELWREEEMPREMHSDRLTSYVAGPFRTQRRAEIASEALASRVSNKRDDAEIYRDYSGKGPR